MTIDITLSDKASPKLKALFDALELDEQIEFMSGLADDFEILTREHITQASKTRHKSAARLGATQTGYLEKIATSAEGVRAEGTPGQVTLRLQGDIFKRTFGPVIVKKKDKWLTIPIAPQSYGRRAAEMGPMFRIKSRKGNQLLVQTDPDDKKKIIPLYVLKDQVTLTQDRGLLPSDQQFLKAAEKAAVRFVKMQLDALKG